MLLARHVPVKLLLSLQVSVSICWCAHETPFQLPRKSAPKQARGRKTRDGAVLYRDNGQENGNYHNVGLCRDFSVARYDSKCTRKNTLSPRDGSKPQVRIYQVLRSLRMFLI